MQKNNKGPKGKKVTGKGTASKLTPGKRGPKFVARQKKKNFDKRAARSAQEQAVRNTQIENAGGWNQAVLPDFLREMLSSQAATNIGDVYDPIESNLRQNYQNDLSRATRGIAATGGQAADMLGGLAQGAHARGQESLAQQAAFGDALTAGLGSGQAAGGLEAALAAAGQDLGYSDQAVLASQGMTQALQGVNVADLNEQVAKQQAEGDFASALPGIAALQAGQTNQALGLQSQANLSEALSGLSTERAGAMFNEQNRLQEVGIQQQRDALNAAIAEQEFGLDKSRLDESTRATNLANSQYYAGLRHEVASDTTAHLNKIKELQEAGRINAEQYGVSNEFTAAEAALDRAADGAQLTAKEKGAVRTYTIELAEKMAKSLYSRGNPKATGGFVFGPQVGNSETAGSANKADVQTAFNTIFNSISVSFQGAGMTRNDQHLTNMTRNAMIQGGFSEETMDTTYTGDESSGTNSGGSVQSQDYLSGGYATSGEIEAANEEIGAIIQGDQTFIDQLNALLESLEAPR